MIIVDINGKGDFVSVAEAVKSASAGEKLLVKAGVYKERVEVLTEGIEIVGESAENTVITESFYAKMPCADIGKLGTFRSYTMLINADNVTCRNITVSNTAGFGENIGQAVAVYAEGDGLLFEDCRFLGRQDTLFTGPLPHKEIEKNGFKGPTELAPRIPGRQTYRRCYIEGDVDFIFGGAKGIFDSCIIHSLDRGEKINGYITAASTFEGQESGYIFKDCDFTGNCPKETVYLGRPWRDFAKTVLLNCNIGGHICGEGFHDWGKTGARNTVFYGLQGCTGEGFRTDRLADFVKVLTEEEAEIFNAIIERDEITR